jgi:hypothetical protein
MLSERDLATMNATQRQLANATLTRVLGSGTLDAWGDENPGSLSEVWSGSVRCFQRRERTTKVIGGAEVIVTVDTVRVFDAEDPDLDLDAVIADSPGEATYLVVDSFLWRVVSTIRDQDGTLDSLLVEIDDKQPAPAERP